MVRDTLQRLLREGLSRHDAIHAIASLLVAQVHELLQPAASVASADAKYHAKLRRLTAKRWRSGKAADVQRIISHPQALAQCRGWLARRFPSLPVDEVASTAHAAMKAAADGSLAAISSALAKEVYNLQTVAEHEILGLRGDRPPVRVPACFVARLTCAM